MSNAASYLILAAIILAGIAGTAGVLLLASGWVLTGALLILASLALPIAADVLS